MFRQRLRGGHRVNSHSLSSPSQNVQSEITGPNALPVTDSPAFGNADGAWNWDAGNSVVYKNLPSQPQHSLPSQQHLHSDTAQHSAISTSTPSPDDLTRSIASKGGPNQAQQRINGTEANTRSNDEWNWGDEENWGEWPANDVSINSNTANNQQKFQLPVSYPQQQSASENNQCYSYYQNYPAHSISANSSNFNFQDPNKNSWSVNSAEPCRQANLNPDQTAQVNFQSAHQSKDLPIQEKHSTESEINSNFCSQESYPHTVTSHSQSSLILSQHQQPSLKSFEIHNQTEKSNSFKKNEVFCANPNDDVDCSLNNQKFHLPNSLELLPDIPSSGTHCKQSFISNTHTATEQLPHPLQGEWNWENCAWEGDAQQQITPNTTASLDTCTSDPIAATQIAGEKKKNQLFQTFSQNLNQDPDDHAFEYWGSDWNNVEVENLKFENAQDENSKEVEQDLVPLRCNQTTSSHNYSDIHPKCDDEMISRNETEDISNCNLAPPTGTWDDEWGDGWEIKPPQDVYSSETSPYEPTSSHSPSNNPVDGLVHHERTPESTLESVVPGPANLDSKTEIYQRVRGISQSDSLPEVQNIEALNQELHGIFSVPSESSLVLQSDVISTPQEMFSSIQPQLSDSSFYPSPVSPKCQVAGKSSPKEFDIAQPSVVKNDSVWKPTVEAAESFLMDGTPPISAGSNNAASTHAETHLKGETTKESANRLETTSTRVESVMGQTQSSLSHSSAVKGESPSLPVTTEPLSTDSPSNLPQPIVECLTSPPLVRSTPVLLQPEVTRAVGVGGPTPGKESVPLRVIHPVTSGPARSIPTLQARKGSPFQPPAPKRPDTPPPDPASEAQDQREDPSRPATEKPLGIQPHNTKMAVAQETGQATRNSLALVRGGEVPPIPAAHLASLPAQQAQQPRVRTLDSITTGSPSVLDLSRADQAPPTFSRMVPGESAEGEWAAPAPYQAPNVVPAMPSGRVVTGNANPQPVRGVRVKQEPGSEVRSPPDGPDTGTSVDPSPGVVPPVRSATIGSEGGAKTRPPAPSDHRDDNEGSRRDRDYYSDRYRDRKRDFYRPDSPRRPPPSERDYEDRRGPRRSALDDHDDADDERHSGEARRERRHRAPYRDELERYDGFESKDRRRNEPQRDRDDPYFEGRSDRSRPTSRSSSYGNLLDASSGGPSSHSPHDDYYDRAHPRERGRDPRDRDALLRDYPHYHRREKSNRDPYARAYHHPYPDQYGPREMYDQHSHYYYYYQKYLEQDPYYREYYRQYYRRYGYNTGDSLVDDKASSRSGRSSVNDELKRSSLSSLAPYDSFGGYYGLSQASDMPSHFRQEFLDHSSLGNFEPSSIYPEHGSFSIHSFPSGNVSGVPSVTDDAGSDTHQRLSPHLFTGPHITASFTSGGRLLLVLPNDPKDGERPTVQVRNVQKMLAVNPEYATRIQKLGSYPGPLTAKETHKDTVLRFCEDKAKAALSNEDLFDRESVVLMWEYLSLLVKQNGNVCGADLANLLIKKRPAGGVSSDGGSLTGASSQERLKDTPDDGSLPDDEPRNSSVFEKLTSAPVPCAPSQGDINKFTEFLCLGRKKEAVDYAIRKGLWSYAMALAAKMDPGTHTRVMSAFIHSIPSSDVLQTLIQHLSGKKPEVTKNYCEERWGDWRQHLAMMVSNPTGNPQRDGGSIIALGDTLAAGHRLHAAHLCYLAAKFEWGTYSDKESRLVLIGSSPTQPFQVFASDDAIQCTEIYEFARSLDVSNPLFRTFQSYKLIYALRLTECAYPTEALKYCEVISAAVTKEPVAFQVEFVSQVLELASQLKYQDVHYQMGEGEMADMPDPKWIQNLQEVLYQLQCQAVEPDSASTIPTHQITDATQSHAPALDSYSPPDGLIGSHTSRGQVPEHQGEHNMYLAAAATPDLNSEMSYYGNAPEYEGRMSAADNYDSVPPSLKKNSILGVGSGGPRSLPVEGFGSQLQQPTYHPYMQPQQSNESIYSNHALSWTGQPQPQQHPWQTQPEPAISTQQADQLHPSVANPASLQWQVQQQQQQQQQQQHQHLQPFHQNISWQSDGSNDPQWQQQTVMPDPPQGFPGNQEDASSDPAPPAPSRSAEEEEYWALMTGKGGVSETGRMIPGPHLSRMEKRRRVTFKAPSHVPQQRLDKRESSAGFENKVLYIQGSKAPGAGPSKPRVWCTPRPAPLGILKATGEDDFEKGIAKSRLVFGGSFPIDAPISARQLGTPLAPVPCKTFQVDSVCCVAPNLCEDHSPSHFAGLPLGGRAGTLGEFLLSVDGATTAEPAFICNSDEEELEDDLLSGCYGYRDDEAAESDEFSDDDDYGFSLDEDDTTVPDFEAGLSLGTSKGARAPPPSSSSSSPSSRPHLPPPSGSFLPPQTSHSSPVQGPVIFARRDAPIYSHSNVAFCPQPQSDGRLAPTLGTLAPAPAASHAHVSAPPSSQNELESKDRGTPQLAGNQGKNEDTPPTKTEDESDGRTEDKKSFFGSLFGGWRKSSNQANLPDDKNPSIVWNEQTKKWENKDGEDNDEAVLPPPPSSLSAVTPQAMGSLRGGNRKSRYVDPVGEKGRTKAAVAPLLPPMPTAATAPLSVSGMNAPEQQPLEGSKASLQNFTHPEVANGSPHLPQTAMTASGQPLSHPGVQEIKNAMARKRFASDSSSVDLTDEFGPGQNQVDNSADAIPMMNLGAGQAPPMFINPAQFHSAGNLASVQPKRSGPARRAFNVQR